MPRTPGIEVRHARSCRIGESGRCNCSPSFRAQVYLKREGSTVRKTFREREEAVAWRQQALVAARRGALRAPSPTRLREAAEDWVDGARSGRITTRSGDPFKPASIRAYEAALRLRVLPALGDMRLTEVRITDLQDFVDGLRAEGIASSTIDCTINSLRAIYRRAVSRGEVMVNPTAGLELPAVRSKPRRFASPNQAAELIAAAPQKDRALWATAFYAGLRRGELMALRHEDVDLAAGVIHVRRGWDGYEGEIAPKSSRGVRRVPVPAVLRDHLDATLDGVSAPTDLIFGTRRRPFCSNALARRTRKAWDAVELEGLTLHEARHTFASLMIAAGVNAKALSTFMGHHSIVLTLDLYGHLMPGSEQEAAQMLDHYLGASMETARSAVIQSERVN
jgi:integrase